MKSLTLALFTTAALVAARTNLAGCVSSKTVNQWSEPSMIWYDPDTYEICEILDCGGGRAPPKTTVPGCAAYEGTATYSPSFLKIPSTSAAATTTASSSKGGSDSTSSTATITKAATTSATTGNSKSTLSTAITAPAPLNGTVTGTTTAGGSNATITGTTQPSSTAPVDTSGASGVTAWVGGALAAFVVAAMAA